MMQDASCVALPDPERKEPKGIRKDNATQDTPLRVYQLFLVIVCVNG